MRWKRRGSKVVNSDRTNRVVSPVNRGRIEGRTESGQSGQQQPKKGGQSQTDNEEEDKNRDRQRRAS